MVLRFADNTKVSVGRRLSCGAYVSAFIGLAFLAAAASAAESSAASSGSAHDYPARPIRVLVTNSPGSGTDIMARLIGGKLSADWAQQVVVDNRPGGGGNIGGEIAARATPDGYTLMLVTSSNAIATALFKKLAYDLLVDFAPISLLASVPYIVVVNPSLPVASLKELLALAKAKPGELNYGSSGAGTGVHLAVELFKSMSQTSLVHVPYKGLNPALTDVMGGQVQLTFAVSSAVVSMIKAGRLRALAVTSSKRSALVPDLPTVSESVPGYEAIGWYGMLAPKRTADGIISKLNEQLIRTLKAKEIQERLSAIGAEPSGTTPAEFRSFMESQIKGYRQAVREAGMRVE